MRVFATAGHVDHGKSTLVAALTGRDPDRWAEERRRGLTIDLGYAWTTLPDGQQIAFVDVPGHQRFIGNMLAGLGPAPAVVLCVAADEGWRRQSAEHLAAASALEIAHGLLVITRADLADPTRALAEARAALAGTPLAGVEAVAVSAVTGAGLPELREALDRLAAALPAPSTTGRVRLWVDRVFTVTGAGTIVTGTLESGSIAVGDTLEVGGRRVVVRGLQSLERARERVDAVARVALNLRGVSPDALARGDALVTPDAWWSTTQVDVRIRRAPLLGAEIPAVSAFLAAAAGGNAVSTGISPSGDPAGSRPGTLPGRLTAHVGTAAIPVRVRPLGNPLRDPVGDPQDSPLRDPVGDPAGNPLGDPVGDPLGDPVGDPAGNPAGAYARLTFDRPLPLSAGDRLVLRDPGRAVLGGAVVLDADPPPLTRRGAARARASALADHPGRPVAAVEIGRRGAVRADHLRRLGVTDLDPAPWPASVATDAAGWLRVGAWCVSAEQADAWAAGLASAVDAHAHAHPLQARMPTGAAAEAAGLPDPALASDLAKRAGVVQADGHLARPGARADLGAAEAGLAELERRLFERPFVAPERDELAALGLAAAHLATAVRLGRLVDLGGQIVLAPRAPALAMQTLAALPQPFTAAAAKEALGTTRRVAIPLLEYLDARGWTRRLGDGRREVRRPGGSS